APRSRQDARVRARAARPRPTGLPARRSRRERAAGRRRRARSGGRRGGSTWSIRSARVVADAPRLEEALLLRGRRSRQGRRAAARAAPPRRPAPRRAARRARPSRSTISTVMSRFLERLENDVVLGAE